MIDIVDSLFCPTVFHCLIEDTWFVQSSSRVIDNSFTYFNS